MLSPAAIVKSGGVYSLNDGVKAIARNRRENVYIPAGGAIVNFYCLVIHLILTTQSLIINNKRGVFVAANSPQDYEVWNTKELSFIALEIK